MRRLLSRALAAFACFGAVAVCAGTSRADASVPLRIRWVAPIDCPCGDFDRELLRLLGGTPPDADAEVDVSTLPDGPRHYRLSLQLSAAGQPATRVLELASCADVRHAAALLIATALQDSEPASGPQHTAAGSLWQLRLVALGDLRSLPALSGGPELGIAWFRAGLRLSLDARYLLAREARDDDSQLRADIDLFAGSLGAAYLLPLGAIALGPSLAVELGWLRARAEGERGQVDGTLWMSGLVGGRAELALNDSFGLMLAAQLCVPLRRPSFSLTDEPPFYETPVVGLRVGIGVNVLFGGKRSGAGGQ